MKDIMKLEKQDVINNIITKKYIMHNLKELSIEEQKAINGGSWRELGRSIGRWLSSWDNGTSRGCGCYEVPIMGDNFVS